MAVPVVQPTMRHERSIVSMGECDHVCQVAGCGQPATVTRKVGDCTIWVCETHKTGKICGGPLSEEDAAWMRQSLLTNNFKPCNGKGSGRPVS